MRNLLIVTILLAAGCEKATPRSTADKPYEAERIRTLTHDEDLKKGKGSDPANLRSAGEALRGTPAPAK